jgi:hypothetical protein
MSSESVENRVCPSCGEMVRPRALFCYNCGENVAEESSVKVRRKTNDEVSDVWFKDSIVAEDKKIKPESKKSKRLKKEVAIAAETIIKEEPVEAFEKKSSESKLKSAATMRNKAKTVQKQRVEMVWDQPETSSGLWFLLMSIILTALVIGILITAWILK